MEVRDKIFKRRNLLKIRKIMYGFLIPNMQSSKQKSPLILVTQMAHKIINDV